VTRKTKRPRGRPRGNLYNEGRTTITVSLPTTLKEEIDRHLVEAGMTLTGAVRLSLLQLLKRCPTCGKAQ